MNPGRRNILRTSFALAVLLFGTSCLHAQTPAWVTHSPKGIVAADSIFASEAGAQILRDGGNAIDAAVAVSFALAVTRPYSTGLGGGAFLIARFANGQVIVQDSRETAPARATEDMFVKRSPRTPQSPPPNSFGYLAAGVPGLVAGRCQILSRFGTLPLDRVIQPALRLAIEGFPVDDHYVETTQDVLKTFQRFPTLRNSCSYVFETHLRKGRLRKAGDVLKQPNLGRLLEFIAREGERGFYLGEIAAAIDQTMRRHGGIITRRDLAQYGVRYRQPLISHYRDMTIIGMPPPSSGGIALAQMLNILEPFELGSLAKQQEKQTIHFRIEAMKHAFADRARWLGDADFVDVPVRHLTSRDYARRLSMSIQPSAVLEPDQYGTLDLSVPLINSVPDDSGTSHFCVADQWGNVVASTETINTEFGSMAAIDEWGLILNDEMDDFVARPGKPNAYGLIQSARNKIEPGKRPLSSMTPTIVLKNNEPFLALGASGGPRIITSVLNVLLSATDHELPLADAMNYIRPHHQWSPNHVFFRNEPDKEINKDLTNRGQMVSNKEKSGVVQIIAKTPTGWVGACDPRKGGRPAGH